MSSPRPQLRPPATSPAPESELPRTLAAGVAGCASGSTVRLQGWVHRRRELSRLTFVVLRDRSAQVQIVVEQPAARSVITTCPEETPIEVVGTVTANASAPGGVEVTAPTITRLGEAAGPSPIELWRPRLTAGLPTLLDHGGVTWRHPHQQAVWAITAASLHGFRATLDRDGFTEVHSPKLVESATESGAHVFQVDYFGRPAFLAQSPQFYKQVLVGAFERVYEVGPVFRAEPHDTVRHLAEYVSLDAEMGFIRDHHDVIRCLLDVVTGMLEHVGDRAGAAVERLGLTLPTVSASLPVVSFREALAIVGAPEDEADLAPAHERALGEWAVAEHDSDFVVVEGYPTAHRAFYSHPDPAEPRWSRSFDLIFRGVELVSGAQRLHRYDDYVQALTDRGLALEPYASYLDAFRTGLPPHGGFAIGLERWVSRLVGAANVREVTLFPRDLHRLSP